MTDVPGGDAPITQDTEIRYGVTVRHVRELASHIGRVSGTVDPDFGLPRAQITDEQIARWIDLVSDSVASRLVALSRYTSNTGLWAGVLGSARTAVTNGAAAYLVSAAFPGRAGVNDQSNYSAELDARFQREMEFLMELPAVLADDETVGPLPVEPGADGGVRASYRPALIGDDSPLFYHTRPMLGRLDPNVYRRPPAPGAEYPFTPRMDPGGR